MEGMNFIYEDELPIDISKEEYNNWYKQSEIAIVRVGPRLHFTTKNCWCCPSLKYVDSDTGNKLWVHNDPQ